MNWWHIFKKKLQKPVENVYREPFELEIYLDEQINHGDVSGAQLTLKRLGRNFFREERISLINKCIETKKFAEALYLVRGLSYNDELENILITIVREAAFADDISTARYAALLAEQMSAKH